MKRACLALVTLLLAAAAGPALASVESLQVATSTWKRSDVRVEFGEGSIGLTLVFDKSLAPAAAAKPSEGFESDEPGPRIEAQLTYHPADRTPAAAFTGNVSGLDGAADSSAWVEEDVIGMPRAEDLPDAPLPRRRVLMARAGSVDYRLLTENSAEELIPFLKALLTSGPAFYKVRREHPGEVEVAGVKPPAPLWKAPEKADFYSATRVEQFPDLEYATSKDAPLVLRFRIRHDDLAFGPKGLEVKSEPTKQTVRVFLRCGKIALFCDTDAGGVADFDIGPRDMAEEWRYQVGGGSPAGIDHLMTVTGRFIVRMAGVKPESPPVQKPDSEDPSDVADALSALVEKNGKAPAAELTCLLWGQPLPKVNQFPWKASAFWLELARGGSKGPVADTAGWLDERLEEVHRKWVEEKVSSSPSSPKAGWSAAQAERLLAMLRHYELEPTRERLLAARKEAGAFFPAVVATAAPADPAEAIAGRAWASLALFKANDLFRETGYRRVAFDLAMGLVEQHVKNGALVAPKGTKPPADLPAHGLVAQALRKAWRSSSKPVFKSALTDLRRTILKSWTPGGFVMPAGSNPSLDEQFWGLSAFTDAFFPYWELPTRDWLR